MTTWPLSVQPTERCVSWLSLLSERDVTRSAGLEPKWLYIRNLSACAATLYPQKRPEGRSLTLGRDLNTSLGTTERCKILRSLREKPIEVGPRHYRNASPGTGWNGTRAALAIRRTIQN